MLHICPSLGNSTRDNSIVWAADTDNDWYQELILGCPCSGPCCGHFLAFFSLKIGSRLLKQICIRRRWIGERKSCQECSFCLSTFDSPVLFTILLFCSRILLFFLAIAFFFCFLSGLFFCETLLQSCFPLKGLMIFFSCLSYERAWPISRPKSRWELVLLRWVQRDSFMNLMNEHESV